MNLRENWSSIGGVGWRGEKGGKGKILIYKILKIVLNTYALEKYIQCYEYCN